MFVIVTQVNIVISKFAFFVNAYIIHDRKASTTNT